LNWSEGEKSEVTKATKKRTKRTWTPTVFCAVTAVMTEEQYAPSAAHALMSAWMPAPAPESEPATVSTCGHGIARADTASLRGRAVGAGDTLSEKQG